MNDANSSVSVVLMRSRLFLQSRPSLFGGVGEMTVGWRRSLLPKAGPIEVASLRPFVTFTVPTSSACWEVRMDPIACT